MIVPANGAERVIEIFIWWPTQLPKEHGYSQIMETRWLERAAIRQQCYHYISIYGYLPRYEWIDVRWED